MAARHVDLMRAQQRWHPAAQVRLRAPAPSPFAPASPFLETPRSKTALVAAVTPDEAHFTAAEKRRHDEMLMAYWEHKARSTAVARIEKKRVERMQRENAERLADAQRAVERAMGGATAGLFAVPPASVS